MSRRSDVYNPEPEADPLPAFRCRRCGEELQVVAGNAGPHECPADYRFVQTEHGPVKVKNVRRVPAKVSTSPLSWMV